MQTRINRQKGHINIRGGNKVSQKANIPLSFSTSCSLNKSPLPTLDHLPSVVKIEVNEACF